MAETKIKADSQNEEGGQQDANERIFNRLSMKMRKKRILRDNNL